MANWKFSFFSVCEITATWQHKSVRKTTANNDAFKSKVVLSASGYQNMMIYVAPYQLTGKHVIYMHKIGLYDTDSI